jgi:hypothetical protein
MQCGLTSMLGIWNLGFGICSRELVDCLGFGTRHGGARQGGRRAWDLGFARARACLPRWTLFFSNLNFDRLLGIWKLGFGIARARAHERAVASCLSRGYYFVLQKRGRTGFDSLFEAQAACRGWFVGLVKIRTKKNKRRSPRSRSRGLIDRDVSGGTPATAGNMDSRLIVRRSDRAER